MQLQSVLSGQFESSLTVYYTQTIEPKTQAARQRLGHIAAQALTLECCSRCYNENSKPQNTTLTIAIMHECDCCRMLCFMHCMVMRSKRVGTNLKAIFSLGTTLALG